LKHIIISDTHAPCCIEKIQSYLNEVLKQHTDVDAIVINGDLLGIFSMDKSSLHKGKDLSTEELDNYLKAAAPKFYNEFKRTGSITADMIKEYVEERYEWAYDRIFEFSKLKKTIFNMGNHESPLHFLVLEEIPFLTGCDPNIIKSIDKKELNIIFELFESKLQKLEQEGNFKYIRNDVYVDEDTLIVGIPGESHATEGQDFFSQKQEEKTKELIEKAKTHLSKVSNIIIYNHTQGKYNHTTGEFNTASKSLREFMHNIPPNVLRRVFVQSHNHWPHSQFMINNGFNILLNNAGLHDGIFNLISFDMLNIEAHDIDSTNKRTTKMKIGTESKPFKNDEELLARYYPNPKAVIARNEAYALLNTLTISL